MPEKHKNYPGLSQSTIASFPLEKLYKHVDTQMIQANSSFDLKI